MCEILGHDGDLGLGIEVLFRGHLVLGHAVCRSALLTDALDDDHDGHKGNTHENNSQDDVASGARCVNDSWRLSHLVLESEGTRLANHVGGRSRARLTGEANWTECATRAVEQVVVVLAGETSCWLRVNNGARSTTLSATAVNTSQWIVVVDAVVATSNWSCGCGITLGTHDPTLGVQSDCSVDDTAKSVQAATSNSIRRHVDIKGDAS